MIWLLPVPGSQSNSRPSFSSSQGTVNVYERYNGPYDESQREILDFMMNKRIVIRIEPTRVRSWDHRKLGMAPMEVAGTTAQYL